MRSNNIFMKDYDVDTEGKQGNRILQLNEELKHLYERVYLLEERIKLLEKKVKRK